VFLLEHGSIFQFASWKTHSPWMKETTEWFCSLSCKIKVWIMFMFILSSLSSLQPCVKSVNKQHLLSFLALWLMNLTYSTSSVGRHRVSSFPFHDILYCQVNFVPCDVVVFWPPGGIYCRHHKFIGTWMSGENAAEIWWNMAGLRDQWEKLYKLIPSW
jgi:hypothetical protein